MAHYKNNYQRKTTRLRCWDYTSPGWYFVTICTRDRQPFFGRIANGVMHLSPIGKIADQCWREIPNHTAGYVSLDAYVVMPDHVHGIIVIHNRVVEASQRNASTISPRAGSLGAIIRSYKAAVTRWCRRNGFTTFSWQHNYYDHIIRREHDLLRIRQYILDNPRRWEMDRNQS